jgi:hypothetical protein
VVLVDGEAVGTWSLTTRGHGVEMFESIGASARKRLDACLAAVELLLTK